MKVLLVYSGNVVNFSFEKHQAFIFDQIEACKRVDSSILFKHFVIKGRGYIGYLKSYYQLRKAIRNEKPDVIHAHYGLSGFIAALTFKKPLVITFHGSDINHPQLNKLSYVASKMANASIYVSNTLKKLSGVNSSNVHIIPCGVDFNVFVPHDKLNIRKKLGLDETHKYILFASSFNNSIKNFELAKKAIDFVDEDMEIIELKNKNRLEVCELINASDILLLTSFSEGSPQVIKEAMACNCPIVATDVGDIREVVGDTEGCYITSFEPSDVAAKIEKAIAFGKRTSGRENINHFDNKSIANKLIDVYKQVLKKEK